MPTVQPASNPPTVSRIHRRSPPPRDRRAERSTEVDITLAKRLLENAWPLTRGDKRLLALSVIEVMLDTCRFRSRTESEESEQYFADMEETIKRLRDDRKNNLAWFFNVMNTHLPRALGQSLELLRQANQVYVKRGTPQAVEKVAQALIGMDHCLKGSARERRKAVSGFFLTLDHQLR